VKSGSRRSKPRSRTGGGFRRTFLLLLVGAALGGLGVYLFRPKSPAPPSSAPRPAPGQSAKARPAPETPADFEPAEEGGHGVVALVLDDLGYGESYVERAARLPGPIALAVLPSAPSADAAAAVARKNGWDLLVHLPLSSETGKREPDEISSSQSDREIEAAAIRAIDRFPGSVGLNNHQGSLAMADRRVVRTLLKTVRDRHLFFLDSRTTPARVAEEEAKSLGTPFLARDVFLDAEGTEGIAPAWARALFHARKTGSVIVIAHPHTSTLDFLESALPNLKARGLRLVKISELVD
jgi:uncharacterized protein